MSLLQRRGDPYMLVVGMTGVKLGDRFAQIGCAHGGRLAAIARKVGLSGRAVVIAPDAASAERARKGAAQAGVLVEVETAPPTKLPAENGAFDLAIIDNTSGLLVTMPTDDREATVREALRILRPGGRVMVIGEGQRHGLAALLGRGSSRPLFDAAAALQIDGLKSVRTLAEREGLIFVEGVKPRA